MWFSVSHTHLFPRALSELIGRHNVQELHVGLTQGLWRYEHWGYPIVDAATGGEAWAWFYPDTTNVNRNWKELSNSLSGIFCASLNFIDDSTSISPRLSFRPKGVLNGALNATFLRYSSLPREIVCTENLTPWKKLLPCDAKLGIASLLNAGHIHNTRYHSIGLHIRNVCRDEQCSRTSLELLQTVSLVYDYTLLGTKNWSLRKLFGQGIISACPLAKSSDIYVDVTSNSSLPFDLSPEPDETVTSVRGGFENVYARYLGNKEYPMSVSSVFKGNNQVLVHVPPPIYANQYKIGYGQQKGGIVLKIYNSHWGHVDVVTLQNFPWYVPVYLHTMKIRANGQVIKPKAIHYQPGKLRENPHSLELVLRLPPKSQTTIAINFDYIFLKWQEYPPDANHGFYIGPAVVSAMLPLAKNFTGLPQDGSMLRDAFNASRSGYLVQVRTEIIVITLPTPDFSMPYNVICLACTVVALAFGPIHNMTTKKLMLKVHEGSKLTSQLRSIWGVFSKKKADKDANSEGVSSK